MATVFHGIDDTSWGTVGINTHSGNMKVNVSMREDAPSIRGDSMLVMRCAMLTESVMHTCDHVI